MIHRWFLPLAAVAGLCAQEAPKVVPESALRVGELERLGEGGREMLILGLDAPGFSRLKATQRKYAYFLYRAALAGHDIMYLQNHRYALDIREVFEALYEHRTVLEPGTAAAVEEYLKLVWANHGQYQHWTHLKFVPRNLTFAQLRQAVKAARKAGAVFQARPGETVDQALARLRPHIFEARVEPVQVNQLKGADPIRTSANGLYDPGLALKDIEALPRADQERLNVRFAARKGPRGRLVAVPEPFKVGGTYGAQLAQVVYWLKEAVRFVDGERVMVEQDGVRKLRFEPVAVQRKALEDLIAYFETGEEQKFKDHAIAWLKTRSAVDYLNGFHEVYKDPRGVIGSYEANVSFRTDAALVDRLSENALYFEARMPWKDAWKRAKVTPPVAEVVNVIVETGDAGPITPAAYNLPNYSDIRKEHGSKNVMLMNVEGARSEKIKDQIIRAFYLPEDQELVRRYGDLGRQWLVYLHEIVGHGSGQPDPSLNGEEPSKRLGPTYSSLEECRADAVALYQFLDPKLAELGAVPAAEQLDAAKAMYLSYLGHQLMAIGEVQGDSIREAHDRGSQLILSYLLQPGRDFGVKAVTADGKVYFQVADVVKARAGVGEILEKLQTFKAMGDREGAAAFFDQFGTRVDKAWQKDAKARLEAIGLPKVTAFVFPQLVPVVEPRGGRDILRDVTLETQETFAEQQLRIKRWSRSRELAPK